MKKLISMTDFDLEQELELRNYFEYDNREALVKIFNYANFLKQLLEIWMFVPCKLVDGVWVVLEKPKETSEGIEAYDFDCQEYQQAKERCLFEGFRIENFMLTNDVIGIDQALTLYSDIESLIYDFDGDIELAQTVIKQIGS